MKRWMMLIAALAATPAMAQEAGSEYEKQPLTPALLAKIDNLPFDRMCSTRGAYQYDFGSTDLPPSMFSIPGLDKVDLPESAAPFRTGAFSGTKWSNRFFMASYDLYLENEKAAAEAIQHLIVHYRKAGWIEQGYVDGADGPLIDMPPGPNGYNFYSERGAKEGPMDGRTGVRASFGHLGGWVTFECTSMPMMVAQANEAFGDLPADTPKPEAVVIPKPESLKPEICTTEDGLAQIDAIFGGKPDAMMRYVSARAKYHEKIVQWKSNRLEKSGKVSKDRLLQITLGGLNGGGDMMAGLGAVMDMFAKAADIAKLQKAGDRPGACRATVAMLKNFEKVDVSVTRQWAGIEAGLDAEAAKRGVSFD